MLSVGIFDVLEPDRWVEYLGAILVAAFTAGAVYSKYRFDAAKQRSEPHAPPMVEEVSGDDQSE